MYSGVKKLGSSCLNWEFNANHISTETNRFIVFVLVSAVSETIIELANIQFQFELTFGTQIYSLS